MFHGLSISVRRTSPSRAGLSADTSTQSKHRMNNRPQVHEGEQPMSSINHPGHKSSSHHKDRPTSLTSSASRGIRRDDTKAGVVSSLLLGRLCLVMLKTPERQLTKSNPRRCRQVSDTRHIEQVSQIPHCRIRFSRNVHT